MKIIIIGNGKVGYAIAAEMAKVNAAGEGFTSGAFDAL